MTVVAYKNGCIAADSAEVELGTIMPYRKKKVRIYGNGMIAGAWGTSAQNHDWLELLEKVTDSLHVANPMWKDSAWIRANVPVIGDGSGGMLVVERDKIILAEDKCPPRLVRLNDYCMTAYGTGGDVALGAMAAGATAVQAVEIACAFDTGCQLPVLRHLLNTPDK